MQDVILWSMEKIIYRCAALVSKNALHAFEGEWPDRLEP